MDGSEPPVLPIRPVRYLGERRPQKAKGPPGFVPGGPLVHSSSGRSYVGAPGGSLLRPMGARPMATTRFIVPRPQRTPSAKLGACKDPYAHQSELWIDADVCWVERNMAACGVESCSLGYGGAGRRARAELVPKNLREACPPCHSRAGRGHQKATRRMSMCLDGRPKNVKHDSKKSRMSS